MKFAIIGGTHGNEPVGIKAIEALGELKGHEFSHSFQTFLANPRAHELGKRYVDSDLNRAFSPTGTSKGYESTRSKELAAAIENQFDFILDLHTTTSNMGLTVILTHLDEISLKAACYLKELWPELKIIISMRAYGGCPYTTSMAKSALTVEVGPVANNVINAKLVLATLKMIKALLSWDFKKSYDYSRIECFKTAGILSYPEGKWMVHPEVDGCDFRSLVAKDALFINAHEEVYRYEGPEIFPLFINEAAYQENNTAMEYAKRMTLAEALPPR